MSQNTRESLSVLMDGESDELELRRVLKALPNDTDAADTWRRYHLARSMMQREQGVDVSVDLSAGIMARLREEPAPMKQGAEPVAHRTGGISFARGAGVLVSGRSRQGVPLSEPSSKERLRRLAVLLHCAA